MDEDFLSDARVHLLSLAFTPQQSARGERTDRELREVSGRGRGVVVRTPAEAGERIECSRRVLNEERRHRGLGRRTTGAADADVSRWYDPGTCGHFLATLGRRLAEALPGLESERARRMARREAIFASTEEFGLIRRTRGDL
ncbi:MAG: hypothetical protein HMLKMBBP_00172 [Planctomycetes bacterium]|nr:hypothetical protein [Planctomycetota bacterium]